MSEPRDDRLATIDERLIALETKLAYQEDAVQQLNAVLLDQQRQIDRLTAANQVLSDRVRTLGEQPGDTGAPERPPHY